MPQLFTNNARALLTTGVSDSASTITIEAAKADLFPIANTGPAPVPAFTDWYAATLQDATGAYEIVYVRTRTAGSGVQSNVLRGQEGTAPRAWSAGTVCGLRLTAKSVQDSIAAATSSVLTIGNQIIDGTKTFLDPIQGNIEGNADTVTNGVYTNGDQSVSGVKTWTSQQVWAGSGVHNFTNVNGAYTGLVSFGGRLFGKQTPNNALLMVNNTGAATTHTFADNGDFTAAGNVTAFSDERLKKDWDTSYMYGPLVQNLCYVQSGTYTRIDTGARQVGVSAQSLQQVMPEAVSENDDGMLSVAYGNAALVACIALSREVMMLRSRLEALEAR